MNRRAFIKGLSSLPFLGFIAKTAEGSQKVRTEVPDKPKQPTCPYCKAPALPFHDRDTLKYFTYESYEFDIDPVEWIVRLTLLYIPLRPFDDTGKIHWQKVANSMLVGRDGLICQNCFAIGFVPNEHDQLHSDIKYIYPYTTMVLSPAYPDYAYLADKWIYWQRTVRAEYRCGPITIESPDILRPDDYKDISADLKKGTDEILACRRCGSNQVVICCEEWSHVAEWSYSIYSQTCQACKKRSKVWVKYRDSAVPPIKGRD